MSQQRHNNSVTTTVSQLKIYRFSGETFKGFEVLEFSMSATTTQLLSSGEFCKLRHETVPIKSASANVPFYTSNSKMPNFELWHSCRKWAICAHIRIYFTIQRRWPGKRNQKNRYSSGCRTPYCRELCNACKTVHTLLQALHSTALGRLAMSVSAISDLRPH